MSEYTAEEDVPDPVCCCGESLSCHTSEHSFVDADAYYGGHVTSPGADQ